MKLFAIIGCLILSTAFPTKAATLFFDDFKQDVQAGYTDTFTDFANFTVGPVGGLAILSDGDNGLSCPSGGCAQFTGSHPVNGDIGLGRLNLPVFNVQKDEEYLIETVVSGDQTTPDIEVFFSSRAVQWRWSDWFAIPDNKQ